MDPSSAKSSGSILKLLPQIRGSAKYGGGVVFGSLADSTLDARTGKELWNVGTGGRIVAAPISFMSDGKQMITIAAGHDLLTFGF